MSLNHRATRRGDTIVEVMFAFAIFSLVAIITVTMMNLGVAAAERSLEVTVVRNEMNAQVEALRFIHSSYVAELTLPETCDEGKHAIKCQQYKSLWETITNNALSPSSYTISLPVTDCNTIYDSDAQLLRNNNAFILNTRKLPSSQNNGNVAYISASEHPDVFAVAPLNARIIYTNSSGDSEDGGNNSTGALGNNNNPLQQFTDAARAEGIWVVGVKGGANASSANPQYYDFYVGTCWNGSGSPSPTSIDTVVRLYNPKSN